MGWPDFMGGDQTLHPSALKKTHHMAAKAELEECSLLTNMVILKLKS
jgi:hypothetical protein